MASLISNTEPIAGVLDRPMITAGVATPNSTHSNEVRAHSGEALRTNELSQLRPDARDTGAVATDLARFDYASETVGLYHSHLDDTVSLRVTLDGESAPPLAPMTLEAGTIVRHRYVLEHCIGRGGDSMVFRARDLHRALPDETADGLIALKALLPERRMDAFALRRLKRSFLQMQCLTDSRIARVFDLDSDGDIWFMSMELIAGRDIRAWLREPASLAQRLKVIGACCEALQYAHSMGVIHGDLKPSNVLVTHAGDVKMIDFGSARTPRVGMDSGLDLSAAATVPYASPQVLAGDGVELRDDIFGLACLCYEILSHGLHPFGGKSALDASRTGMCPIPVPDIPARLFEVVAWGLSLDREQRPHSAQEFLEGLVSSNFRGRVLSGLTRIGTYATAAGAAWKAGRPPDDVARSSSDNTLQGTSRTPVYFKRFDRPKSARLTLSGIGRRLWTPSLSFWSSPHHMVQVALLAAIVGIAVLALTRQAERDSIVATPELPRGADRSAGDRGSSPPSVPYTLPNRLEAAASPALEQPEPLMTSGSRPASHPTGVVEFESATLVAGAAQPLIAIPVRRLRATQDRGAVAWAIEDGTARAGVDYQAIDSKVIRFNEGQGIRVLFIPMIKSKTTAAVYGPRTFTVRLRKVAGGPALGPLDRVTVTIAPLPISGGSVADHTYR